MQAAPNAVQPSAANYGYPQPMAGQAGQAPPPMGAPPGYAQSQMAQGGYVNPAMAMAAMGAPPPQPIQFMPQPTASAPNGCPPGLEYLTMVDQLLVHQQMELLEILTGFETNNKYQVKNTLGQVVYFAVENNSLLVTNTMGPQRPFTMDIIDSLGRKVMKLDRPSRCQCCCCPCCLQILYVHAPAGTQIGVVKQSWGPCTCYKPVFEVCDANEQPVLKIECECACCKFDVDFDVYSKEGRVKVGLIQKKWSGMAEMISDADNFGVTFPMDLDVKMKATLLAATFLIDFMMFESNNHHRGHHHHHHHGFHHHH